MNQKKAKLIRRIVAEGMPAANIRSRLIPIKVLTSRDEERFTYRWHQTTQRAIYKRLKKMLGVLDRRDIIALNLIEKISALKAAS